jgi:hypothetical protein
MKKTFLVLFVIAIAMTGIVSAENDTAISQPIGGDAGFYDITSSPSGAAVTVDSTPVGNTPTTATVYVTGTPGHTIAVNLAGYQPWSQYYSGNPAAGQHIAVHASLVPIVQTGNIYVRSWITDMTSSPLPGRSMRFLSDGIMFRCQSPDTRSTRPASR